MSVRSVIGKNEFRENESFTELSTLQRGDFILSSKRCSLFCLLYTVFEFHWYYVKKNGFCYKKTLNNHVSTLNKIRKLTSFSDVDVIEIK